MMCPNVALALESVRHAPRVGWVCGPTIDGLMLEKLVHPRHCARFDIWLIDDHGGGMLRGRSENISRSGVYVVVSLPSNVQPGRHYRVRACPRSPWSGYGNATRVLGDATAVRVEPLVGEDEDLLGIGLLLDAPSDWLAPRHEDRPVS